MKTAMVKEQTVLDPVCGMTIDPQTAAGKYEYNGETFYFCSPGCLGVSGILCF